MERQFLLLNEAKVHGLKVNEKRIEEQTKKKLRHNTKNQKRSRKHKRTQNKTKRNSTKSRILKREKETPKKSMVRIKKKIINGAKLSTVTVGEMWKEGDTLLDDLNRRIEFIMCKSILSY